MLLNNYLFFIFFSSVLGAVLGSFLGVVADRVPEEKKISGRSVCLKCKRQLSVFELVPVVSFLFLRGKCFGCNKKIPFHVFGFEVVSAVLFGLYAFKLGLPVDSAGWMLLVLGFVLIALSVVVFWVDLKHFLILDFVLLPVGILALGLRIGLDVVNLGGLNWNAGVLTCLLCALLFYSIFGGLYFLSKGKWFGYGDVKLLVVLAIFFGFKLFLVLWVASVTASVWSVYLLMRKKANMKTKLPFGSFLVMASLLLLFYGTGLSEVFVNLVN